MKNLNETVTPVIPVITEARMQALRKVAEELEAALTALQTFNPNTYEGDTGRDYDIVESILLDIKFATNELLPSKSL